MDKKKVKEHIQRALVWIDPMTTESANYETAIKMAAKNLEFAMEELSKSDWVSVEDGLPEYGENVWIRSKNNLPEIVGTDRRYRGCKEGSNVIDEYGFLTYYNATHWKPIEKLEE